MIIKNKKGLSVIIGTLLLVLLVIISTAIVWGFVSRTIKEKTEGSETCFKAATSQKITINDYYTCFNSTSGEVQFSVDIGDIDINGLLISILAEGTSKSITLTDQLTNIANVRPYKSTGAVKIPDKNSGLTYMVGGFSSATKIDWIKIAPIIEEKQCDPTDSTYEIEDCSLLAS